MAAVSKPERHAPLADDVHGQLESNPVPAMKRASQPATRSWRQWFKQLLTVVLTAAIAGGASYGVAWWQGRSEVARVESDLSSYRDATDRKFAVAQAESEATKAALQRQLGMIAARVNLYRALTAIEEHNFGTAQQSLQLASGLLAEHASDDARARELAGEVASLRVVTATDVRDQWDAIRGLIRRLDAAGGIEDVLQ